MWEGRGLYGALTNKPCPAARFRATLLCGPCPNIPALEFNTGNRVVASPLCFCNLQWRKMVMQPLCCLVSASDGLCVAANSDCTIYVSKSNNVGVQKPMVAVPTQPTRRLGGQWERNHQLFCAEKGVSWDVAS